MDPASAEAQVRGVWLYGLGLNLHAVATVCSVACPERAGWMDRMPPETHPAKRAKEWPALSRKTPRLSGKFDPGRPGITVWAKWQSSPACGDGAERS